MGVLKVGCAGRNAPSMAERLRGRSHLLVPTSTPRLTMRRAWRGRGVLICYHTSGSSRRPHSKREDENGYSHDDIQKTQCDPAHTGRTAAEAAPPATRVTNLFT